MAFNNRIREMSFSDTYIMVAGIDFGTTFSAYAFSFKSSEGDIRMNSNWGAAVGCESHKTPTCVMTKPNGEFHSFGYDAENVYSQLDADQTDPQTGYNLYRHFKMALHKQVYPPDTNLEHFSTEIRIIKSLSLLEVQRHPIYYIGIQKSEYDLVETQGVRLSSTVTSTSGNVRPAIDIFAMALQYLKQHLLDVISKAVESLPDLSLIRWVVTVPAIWTDESKRFMREAAFRAGLISSVNSKKLMIALEPEAASVFCKTLESQHFIQGCQVGAKKMKAGEKIMIIDAGGGTIDITIHKLKISGDIEEVIPPSGGPWGGIYVDEKFVSLLSQIFGSDFLNNFRAKEPNQWLAFQLNFEKAKRVIDPESETLSGKISIIIPWSIATEYSSFTGKGIDKVINEKAHLGVSFKSGNLVISSEKSREIFQSVINLTIQHVRTLLQDPRAYNLAYILLVGGFGECKYLQKAISDAFAGKAKILIPLSAQLAIIKGAVMYGHRPEQIACRIARFNYGCSINQTFNENLHDPEKAIWVEGIKKCCNVFYCLIKKNDVIETLVPYKHSLYRPKKDSNKVDFTIYSTSEDNTTYVDEPGLNTLGRITLRSPDGPLGKKFELQLTFGGTELLVEARDKSRGHEFPVNMTIDFMQD